MVGLFYTFLALNSSVSGVSMATFEMDANLKYQLSFLDHPWSLFVFGGGYYRTTWVTDNSFGYQNMYGPQLGTEVLYLLKSGDALGAIFKYGATFPSGIAISFVNREESLAGEWVHLVPNWGRFTASLAVSTVSLEFSNVLLMSSFATTLSLSRDW